MHYAAAERLRHVPSDQQVMLGTDAAQSAGLEPIADDEPLVREYLEQLLLQEEGDAFAEHLRADWLEEQLATARLLAGAPEPERWAAMLGPVRLAALRERVDLELTVRNPARVAADAPVALEIDVKNVPRLVVKTYRIDAVAHFLARHAEVDTTIDLDGLVASDEQVILGDAPAIQRVRRQIALPGCDRPGTYVIELIGGGKSSRALIRKGGLRHTVRVGLAGPTIRVLTDDGRPLDDARIWLAGREFAPRDDGAITIPFSTAPSRATILLVHGDIAQAETLQHPAEHYQFHAGIHLERESLVPGKTARVLLRPMLTVAGWPAPVALIEDPVVELTVTDGAGTTSTKTQPVLLRDDSETVVELVVPEDAAQVSVTARGQVRVASTQKTVDLADSAGAEVGRIHRSEYTEALHLSSGAEGHVLHLLGKTGEPRAGRAVALSFKHVAVTFEMTTTLESDARGRIELGALAGIERLTASLPTSEPHHFHLWPELDGARTIHVVAGEQVLLPRPPAIEARDVSLVELRGGAPARDVSARVSLGERVLAVAGDLAAGEYLLQSRGVADVRLVVVPADTPVSDGWAAAGPTSIELSPPLPLLTSLRVDGEYLRLKLDGAGPLTRVHVLATRYRPDRALPRNLRRAPRPPLAGAVAPVLSHYVSGRDIGDEYRYVLERRNHPRRPGMLLEKPGLLLNPWAVRTTTTGVQHAKGGGGYAPARRAPRPRRRPPPRVRRRPCSASRAASSRSTSCPRPRSCSPTCGPTRAASCASRWPTSARPRACASSSSTPPSPASPTSASRPPSCARATSGCASPSPTTSTSPSCAASTGRPPAPPSSSRTCAPASSSWSTRSPAPIKSCSRSAPPTPCASSPSSPSGTPSTTPPAAPATASTPATSCTCSSGSATPSSSPAWCGRTSRTSGARPSSITGCSAPTSRVIANRGRSAASTRSSGRCWPAACPRCASRSCACSATRST
ncbi:hypothetical protein [Nannocystis pusilla]|uniref:hypothetical protein n=1 Tax=Nannocystis pusilla TaxID=889268 RepID=UPI003B785583